MIAYSLWVKNLGGEKTGGYFPGVDHVNKQQPEYKLGGVVVVLLLLSLLFLKPNITAATVAYYLGVQRKLKRKRK